MPTSILATKLFIPPPAPQLVPRLRLRAHLNEGAHRALTLVSAPAGFGKTTLVSTWVATCGRPVAWLSLDARDSEPARFLTYLFTALQTIAEGIGERELHALHSPQPPPVEAILTGLINALAALHTPAVLVLDDYHAVDSPEVDDTLAFLLEHLPPSLHLVVTTREEPQFPLARLRARGQLTEVRAGDLRFTPDEATTFLNQAMGLALDAAEVAALEARTEGWIAGLQLAALSMRGRDDVHGFVQAFAGDNRYIVDYLVDEVLAQQPAATRAFLLQTSILDRLCGALCEAVTGQENGGGMLAVLERANLFVIPLDDQRRWYRYHALFADVLRAHLQAEQPDRVAMLHQRASAWHAEHGAPAEAIRHALAAGDFLQAAALIEQVWPAMDRDFQTKTWLAWAAALPETVVDTRPVLAAAYAWALLNRGALETAEARLAVAERWLAAGGQPQDSSLVAADATQLASLPATVATARAFIAQAQGDVAATVRHGVAALDLVPADDDLRRGIAGALLGVACWTTGDLDLAHDTLAEGVARLRAAGNLLFALRGTYVLADIRLSQGRLHDAIRIYATALQQAADAGEHIARGTADLHLRLAELYAEQSNDGAAARHVQQGNALGEQAASPYWRFQHTFAQARMARAQGDLDAALALLDVATDCYARGPVPDIQPVAAWKARVWIAQGKLAAARDWARTAGLSIDDELSYLREFEHITLARLLLAEGRTASAPHALAYAQSLLARLLHAAEAGGRYGSALEILVIQALTHAAQGNPPAALDSLGRALTIAAPEGYVRMFVAEGAPMAELLTAASPRGVAPEYASTVLAAFAAPDTPAAPSAAQPQPLVDPLSPREVEVLRLIADGLSNRAIADRLFLALSTVKGHNRIIFDKLQVQRRTEAVARARKLGIL